MDAKTVSYQARQPTTRFAEEVPVSLTYNGVAHVVMMMTPSDIEDFVTGFSLTEGIVETVDELEAIEVRSLEEGLLASVQLPASAFARVEARRRNLPGQTSCGICGLIELEAALPPLPKVGKPPALQVTSIERAYKTLSAHQPLNGTYHALHAAALFDGAGEIVLAREDVGRHTAFDKLIGAAAQAGLDPKTHGVLLSSRCSVELVQKAARGGFCLLATVSAPTSLAVETAGQIGLTLLCRVRAEGFDVVQDPHGLFSPIDVKGAGA